MMITIKLPYSDDNKEFKDIIKTLQCQQSCIIRYAVNRFREGLKLTEIRHSIKKNMNNIDKMNGWFIDSAIAEAQTIHSSTKNRTSLIFGGKGNWIKYVKGKITKKEWKETKNFPFTVSGEKQQNGNRNFNVNNLIENNEIIFKFNRKQHFKLTIPKTRISYHKQLVHLQEQSQLKNLTYTVKLDCNYIYLTFEPYKVPVSNLNKNRIFGIDMNPNEIGWSVLEFDKKDNLKIIDNGIISIKELNESNPNKNKKAHETYQVSKWLVNKSKHYKCAKFVIEDLNIKNKNHNKGRNFNRLINNQWNRLKLELNLKKRCGIYNIEFIKVNPAYSSFVGNLLHGKKYPDPIAPAIEIARRGYNKFVKGWFYPKLITIENLPNEWKDAVDCSCKSWIILYNRIKKLGLKYHFSWKGHGNHKFLSMNTTRLSKIKLIELSVI